MIYSRLWPLVARTVRALAIAVPLQHRARGDHRAADFDRVRSPAPRRRARTARAAPGHAGEDRGAVEACMTAPQFLGPRRAQDPYQRRGRLLGRRGWAWVATPARSVRLACGDPVQAQPWSLLAPDRTVAVPDADWRTGEGVTLGDDGTGREQHGNDNHRVRLRRRSRHLKRHDDKISFPPERLSTCDGCDWAAEPGAQKFSSGVPAHERLGFGPNVHPAYVPL